MYLETLAWFVLMLVLVGAGIYSRTSSGRKP